MKQDYERGWRVRQETLQNDPELDDGWFTEEQMNKNNQVL